MLQFICCFPLEKLVLASLNPTLVFFYVRRSSALMRLLLDRNSSCRCSLTSSLLIWMKIKAQRKSFDQRQTCIQLDSHSVQLEPGREDNCSSNFQPRQLDCGFLETTNYYKLRDIYMIQALSSLQPGDSFLFIPTEKTTAFFLHMRAAHTQEYWKDR